jgi:16S rRNA (guanine527-N7)-methyltransferase
LIEGAKTFELALSEPQAHTLLALSDELARWNSKVNLTAIESPEEVIEKHLLDSLAIHREVAGAKSLLDIGAGAGFPGLPLAILFPEMATTLVEAVGKKVGFMKTFIARQRLQNARAVQQRSEGKIESEKLPRADAVVSRALMDLPKWVLLGSAYVSDFGTLIAMVGPEPRLDEAVEAASVVGLRLLGCRSYSLPFSNANRSVVTFRR